MMYIKRDNWIWNSREINIT